MDETQLLLKNQICFPIYSASRLITKAYKVYLDKLELTYPQYLVLLVLWEQDEISINTIKEKLILDTNTLSPMLKRMEKSGIIQRTKSHIDERSVIIELTTKGKNLKKEALPIPEKLAESVLTEEITIEGMIQIKETLENLIKELKRKLIYGVIR